MFSLDVSIHFVPNIKTESPFHIRPLLCPVYLSNETTLGHGLNVLIMGQETGS